jgi:AraC-like DNA-binding protein
MVLTSRRDVTFMTVRGPQTWATELQYSADLEWFGIRFRLGTLMPNLPPGLLSDGRDANLPRATGSSFWLHNAAWQFPNFDNADAFVRRLERAGLLTYDPVVQAARHGRVHELSVRSVQYHFAHATGLTHSMIRQIERARTAAALMERGTPVLDAVHELGYFDQPHMTRSLKRFLGRTPAQIARGG